MERPHRSAHATCKIGNSVVRCLEILAAEHCFLLRPLRKREQEMVQGTEDIWFRRIRTDDARQRSLASNNDRILRSQRTRPRGLELYADDPAENALPFFR